MLSSGCCLIGQSSYISMHVLSVRCITFICQLAPRAENHLALCLIIAKVVKLGDLVLACFCQSTTLMCSGCDVLWSVGLSFMGGRASLQYSVFAMLRALASSGVGGMCFCKLDLVLVHVRQSSFKNEFRHQLCNRTHGFMQVFSCQAFPSHLHKKQV